MRALEDINELSELIEEAFGNEPRPEHFTDFEHCCECAEHDETLAANTPESISFAELGNPGWDPICFATNNAFKYYFPALARLTLTGTDATDYTDQFLFHIIIDGPDNRRLRSFKSEQKKAVVSLLNFLLENRSAEIERFNNTDNLFAALEIWSQTDDWSEP